jgi:hypothetical protein
MGSIRDVIGGHVVPPRSGVPLDISFDLGSMFRGMKAVTLVL